MNLWNVAFVNLPDRSRPPMLIYLGDKPISSRIYTCVVKWWEESHRERRISIESLRFSRFIYDENPENPEVDRLAESEEPIADLIEFAAYGQMVIRNGRVVKPQEIVHQFSDIRHIPVLSNLNPEGPLYRTGTEPSDIGKPRYYFGYERHDDV